MTPEQETACLRYSFDSDSKGDSDVRLFGTRMVVAAKPHIGKCFPCMGDIATGERHRVERGLMDGRMGTARTCYECCVAMSADDDGSAIERRYSLGRQRAELKREAA